MLYVPRHRRQSRGLDFNSTPLIDIIFTLSIFYMLISVVSSQEFVPMELPDPAASQAVAARTGERVVLNCRAAADGETPLYSLGANPPEPLSALAAQLVAWRRESPGLGVVIRADRRLQYRDVRAAMAMVAEQKIEVLNVAALTSD